MNTLTNRHFCASTIHLTQTPDKTSYRSVLWKRATLWFVLKTAWIERKWASSYSVKPIRCSSVYESLVRRIICMIIKRESINTVSKVQSLFQKERRATSSQCVEFGNKLIFAHLKPSSRQATFVFIECHSFPQTEVSRIWILIKHKIPDSTNSDARLSHNKLPNNLWSVKQSRVVKVKRL